MGKTLSVCVGVLLQGFDRPFTTLSLYFLLVLSLEIARGESLVSLQVFSKYTSYFGYMHGFLGSSVYIFTFECCN